MSVMASQITSLTIVYSTVYSGADQRKLQSSASLAFLRGIHRWPVNSPHKGPVTRKMLPFDDVIMCNSNLGGDDYMKTSKYYPTYSTNTPGVLCDVCIKLADIMVENLSEWHAWDDWNTYSHPRNRHSWLYISGALILKNRAQMLSHDFHILLCPYFIWCDKSFVVLPLGILFGVK